MASPDLDEESELIILNSSDIDKVEYSPLFLIEHF
jgi:hypothetical protein